MRTSYTMRVEGMQKLAPKDTYIAVEEHNLLNWKLAESEQLLVVVEIRTEIWISQTFTYLH